MIGNRSFAQSDSIYYVVEKAVINRIENYINEADKLTAHYYGIWNTCGDTTSILIVRLGERDGGVSTLIKNSNRFLRIKNELVLPIVLRADILFSENLNVINNKGEKYESIMTTTLTPSGFLIVFRGTPRNIKIVRSEYFQF